MSKKKRLQKKIRKSAMLLFNRSNINFFRVDLHIPHNWKFLIIQKKIYNTKCAYLYSQSYFFLVPLKYEFSYISFDPYVSALVMYFTFYTDFYRLFWLYLKFILNSFSQLFFRKIKFKGKGYYMYKNFRNTIALQFGYSHKIYLYAFFVTMKFTAKTIILMFGINRDNLFNRSRALFNLRPINVFTGRGIRFSRQVVYRKVGKISSYR